MICLLPSELDHFEMRIRPVLLSSCSPCHASSAAVPQAGLTLDTARGPQTGGRSGPVIEPGDPKDLKMPPGKPLAPEVVADFELWIRSGAPLPADAKNVVPKQAAFWSLTKPQMRAVPEIGVSQADRKWVRGEIDAFIPQKLAARGLKPSNETDKCTLIRWPRPTMASVGEGTGSMWRATPIR
jgi:hypothetical protein